MTTLPPPHPGRALLVVDCGDGRPYRRRLRDVDERHPVYYDDEARGWRHNPQFCGDREAERHVLDYVAQLGRLGLGSEGLLYQ